VIYAVYNAMKGDARFNLADRMVLTAVCKYANSDGTRCTVAVATLARDLCVSESTVARALTRLTDFGMVTRQRRKWRSAITPVVIQENPDLSLVPVQEDQEDQDLSPVPVQEDQDLSVVPSRPVTGDDKTCHQRQPTDPPTDLSTDLGENISDRSARTSLSDGPTFDEFYVHYPRHEKRAAAENAWKRLRAADRRAALEALPQHLGHWQKSRTETKYIPLPGSWLNGKRWEDELAVNGAHRSPEDVAEFEAFRRAGEMRS